MNRRILFYSFYFLVVLLVSISIYQAFTVKNISHAKREFNFLDLLTEKSYNTNKELLSISSQLTNFVSHIGTFGFTKDYEKNREIVSKLVELNNLDIISIIYILDSSGICRYSTDKNLLNNDYSFRPYFKKVVTQDSYIYPAKGVTTDKYGVYYSKSIRKNGVFLGAIIVKFPPKSFSTELIWEEELPKDKKDEIYIGILTKDNILLTTNTEKLYHLSSVSGELSNKLNENRQFYSNNIINLKLLGDNDTYSFLSSHRILHRKNFYKENFLIFSTPVHDGELLQIHIIPHHIFEQYFDNQGNFIENIFRLLSAPLALIIILILIIAILTISYKRNTEILINDSNIKEAEAAVASIAKDEFLAIVTHELRTPLNGIMGITTLLRDTDPTERQQEYLNMINSCSTSLLKIINDVLDISRIRSGIMLLETAPFNLAVLIHEIITPIEVEAHKKDLSFYLDQSSDIPEWLIGDAQRLRQILNNLLNNAIKFTDIGNIKFQIEANVNKDHICELTFRIADTGIGMLQDDQKKIFESFTQAEMSTTRLYGGMGLGLSIAKNLSNLMNGTIDLSSILGKGTTFIFKVSLPISELNKNKDKENI